MNKIIIDEPKRVSKIVKAIDDAYWACYRFIRDYIFNPIWYRIFGYKHHIVRTGLPPAPWYDTDTRMLYAVMSLVEWFVENDMRRWSVEERLCEIDRIKTETQEEDMKKQFLDQINDQWDTEDEIIKVYEWWKDYPRRQKEIEDGLHEWHDYINSFRNNDTIDVIGFFRTMDSLNGDDKSKERELNDRLHKLEQNLANEEQEMLKKAIDLRGAMWS